MSKKCQTTTRYTVGLEDLKILLRFPLGNLIREAERVLQSSFPIGCNFYYIYSTTYKHLYYFFTIHKAILHVTDIKNIVSKRRNENSNKYIQREKYIKILKKIIIFFLAHKCKQLKRFPQKKKITQYKPIFIFCDDRMLIIWNLNIFNEIFGEWAFTGT